MDAQLQFFTTSRGFTTLHILCALLTAFRRETSTTDFHLRASRTLPDTRRYHTAVCTTHELHSPETFELSLCRTQAQAQLNRKITNTTETKSRRWRSTGKLENRVDCQTHRCPPPELPVNFVDWWMLIAITPLIARFSLAEHRHSHLDYPRLNASCLYLYQVPFLLPTSILYHQPSIYHFRKVAWRPKTAPSYLKVRVSCPHAAEVLSLNPEAKPPHASFQATKEAQNSNFVRLWTGSWPPKRLALA